MTKKRVIDIIDSSNPKAKRWKALFATGRMAYEAGEFRRAETQLARARELSNELPQHSFAALSCEIGMAAIHLATGKQRDAAAQLQKIISKLEAPPDDDHKELLAVALRFYSESLVDSGDPREAEKCLKKSAEILEDLGVDSCVQLSYTLCDLCGLYLSQGRQSEAEKYILSAMEILQATVGPEAPEYTKADMIYTACMPMSSAARIETVADGIEKMEYMYGNKHPNIHRALSRYLKFLTEKGATEKIIEVKEKFGIKKEIVKK